MSCRSTGMRRGGMTPRWRTRVVTGAALALEACALYLAIGVLAGLANIGQLQMPLWLIAAAMVWGYGLARWALGLRVTPALRGLAGLALGGPSLLVLAGWNAGEVLPFGLLASGGGRGAGLLAGSVGLLLVIWWRAASLAREEVTLDGVRGSFQAGLATLLGASVVDAVTPGGLVSGWLVAGFFAVGLGGMALARFESESGEERDLPGEWVWPIAASVGGVLLLGLAVSGLGLGGLDDVARALARGIGAAGYWLLEPALLLVGLLAGALVGVGNWFSELLGGGNLDGLLEAQRRLDQFHQSLREAESEPGGNGLLAAMRWAAAALGAVAAAWVVFALFRARRRGGRGGAAETRESWFSLSRAGDDLGGALGGLLAGLGGDGRGGSRRRRLRSVRDYYHALLELAGRAGRPKGEGETPREHQRGLSGVLPADPVGRMVDEFQEAHYGGAEPGGAAQLERLESDRRELEEFLRRNPPEG